MRHPKPQGVEEPLLPLSPDERYELFHSRVSDWLDLQLVPKFHQFRQLLLAGSLVASLGVGYFAYRLVDLDGASKYSISASKQDFLLLFALSQVFALVPCAVDCWWAYWLVFASLVLQCAKAIAFNYESDMALPVLCLSGQFLHVVCSSRLTVLQQQLTQANLFMDSRGASGDIPFKRDEDEEDKELSLVELLKVLKPYFYPKGWLNKLRCVLTYMLLFSAKACNLFAPLFIGQAVQSLSEGDEAVYSQVGTYCSLLLASKVSTELQNICYLKVKQNAFVEIAELTFSHLHALSFDWHVRKKLGTTMRSLDRGSAAADTIVSYLFMYLFPSLVECLVTLLVFYHHFNIPSLSALVFVSFCAYVVLTVKLTLWRIQFRALTNKHDNDFHSKATDSLQNFETVKYFTAERFETDRYVDAVRKFQTYSVFIQVSLGVLNITQQVVLQACACGALLIAAYHVREGDVALGQFVSVQVYVMQLFAPLSFLGSIYNAIVTAMTDMSNLSQLLHKQPDVLSLPHAQDLQLASAPPQVEFKQVYFKYPTAANGNGLRDVSFVVPAGTETAIVGKTGSGKTSLFRLLLRFYDPDSGQVLINGQDIRLCTLDSVRGAVGVVPQDCIMFNETILFNLKYGNQHASQEQVEEACKKAQLWDLVQSFERKFDTQVGGNGAKLSGGERQRVAIARCLLKNAPILVLDEFSSALDAATEKDIHEAINATLVQSRTVLVIAHKLSTIRKSQQIIVLEDGLVLERGTHEQLLENRRGKYTELWTKQNHEELDQTMLSVTEEV